MTRLPTVVARYTTSTFESYRDALRAIVPALDEPAIGDPAPALRRLGLLVESVIGFAIGAALGRVTTAIRRGFGDTARRAVANDLAIAVRNVLPPPRVPPAGTFLADAEQRPMLDLLGATLHARLCAAVPTARDLVLRVHDTFVRAAPDRLAQLDQTLELLAADDAGAIAFGDHLTAGWTQLRASLGNTEPSLPDSTRWERTRASWLAWTERVAGDRPVLEPSHEEVVAAGYVMRVG